MFNEHLPAAAEPTEVSLSGDGPAALVLAVTPELSLAWKVQWLITDMYPQAKDLYDAVLLAERTPLRCLALARFETGADAALLCAYLDKYLPRPDCYYTAAVARDLVVDAI